MQAALPDLYRPEGDVYRVPSLADFSGEALEAYRRDGCVAVDHVFDQDTVEAALAGLQHLASGGVPGFPHIEIEPGRDAANIPPGSILDHVRKLMFFTPAEPRLRALAEDAPLLDAVQRILGATPRLFQDMALLKPPGGGREKPWHQDKAYFRYALDTPVCGV